MNRSAQRREEIIRHSREVAAGLSTPADVQPGMVATSRTLIPASMASTYVGPDGTRRFRKVVAPIPAADVWGVEPSKRRTPSERVESLARRIQTQAQYGMPASVFTEARNIVDKVGREGVSDDVLRDIQAMAWQTGRALSFEECRSLARVYITDAEKEQQEKDRHMVVTKSPYVLDTRT